MRFCFLWRRLIPPHILCVFADLMQYLTVMLMFDAPFPKALRDLYVVFARLSFGIEVVTPECAVTLTFYARYGLAVGLVFAMCAILVRKPLVEVVLKRRTISETLVLEISTVALRDLFVLVLLFHPTLSGMTMQFFRCQTIDLDEGPTPYLMADYSLVCYQGAWYATLPLALVVLFLFSFGTPCAIAWATIWWPSQQ